jgi:uncharacterized protein YcfL
VTSDRARRAFAHRSVHQAGALSCAALVYVLMLTACTSYEPYPVCDFRKLSSPGQDQDLPRPALVSPAPGALQPMPLETVNITDRNILRKVMVQSVAARRTETKTVQASAQVVNCTDHPLQVEARTHFYDAVLVEAEPVSAWQRVMLAPRTLATYSERSIGTEQVASYLIELREGR